MSRVHLLCRVLLAGILCSRMAWVMEQEEACQKSPVKLRPAGLLLLLPHLTFIRQFPGYGRAGIPHLTTSISAHWLICSGSPCCESPAVEPRFFKIPLAIVETIGGSQKALYD